MADPFVVRSKRDGVTVAVNPKFGAYLVEKGTHERVTPPRPSRRKTTRKRASKPKE